jgi:hypothetical protein
MRLQRLIALTAVASFALAPVTNAQNTQGPLPQPQPMSGEAQPLQPGGTADTATRSRLARLGSVVGIDGGLFIVTALGLVAISNNNDPSSTPTTTPSTTSTAST